MVILELDKGLPHIRQLNRWNSGCMSATLIRFSLIGILAAI